MEKSEVWEKVLEVLSEASDKLEEEISGNMTLGEGLGIGSPIGIAEFLELHHDLQNKFDIAIPRELLPNIEEVGAKTVNDVVELMHSLVNTVQA